MIPTLEGHLTVAPGRRLAYSLAGPRDGYPVVYLHGGIGTPIRCAPQLGELIARLGIRHLAVNRPGFAGSDPAPGRRIDDFPEDLRRVADHLGLERFVVVGISSGGPYALAAARAMPQRIAATGVVSCISPLAAPHESAAMPAHVRVALRTLVERPALVEGAAERILALVARHRHQAVRLAMLGAPRADRRTLGCASSRESAVTSVLEAASGGVHGMLDDYSLVCRPWGFDVREITGEVHLWHGAEDQFVPLEHAQALAAELPNCRARIGTDDGHFFYRRRMGTVLETLLAAARRADGRPLADPAPAGALGFATPLRTAA